MTDFSNQPPRRALNANGPRHSRREFLLQAGMAGALLGVSGLRLHAQDKLPPDTKIEKLGLSADDIKTLTPTDKELTKKDLLKLTEIYKNTPKGSPNAVLTSFNAYLKKEGKKELTVKDLEALKKATARHKKATIEPAFVPCCCSTCSASALPQPIEREKV
jgi:hypothetical protein